MTYEEAINWLFVQLPMYQNIGKTAYKADLKNIKKLSSYLGNPELEFKSIHVAGTNGKGSTSHMLASVLQEAGFKVGLYTSPHLKDFRERIKINGEMASENFVVNFVNKHQEFFKENHLSFFEMTVGMAFSYFAMQKVDVAVIEVGLGGRLDSTNIIVPEISVITNIGLDHTAILGNTFEKIALEKAGVIKSNVPCVVGRTTKETKEVFVKVAKENKAELYFAEEDNKSPYITDLAGEYQKENLKTAFRTLQVLSDNGWKISDLHLKKGFLNVVKNTGLQGRWQVLNEKPFIVCDTAHNEDGLSWVMEQVSNVEKEKLHVVLGVVSDKDLEVILSLFPKDAMYYFAKPSNVRGLSEDKLKEAASSFELIGQVYSSISLALRKAKENANTHDMIYIGGSTFVVAEII